MATDDTQPMTFDMEAKALVYQQQHLSKRAKLLPWVFVAVAASASFCGVMLWPSDGRIRSTFNFDKQVASARCAYEGEMCFCTGTVVFGGSSSGSSAWSKPMISEGELSCARSTFGEDPSPGARKSCWCKGTIASPIEQTSSLPSLAKVVSWAQTSKAYLDDSATSWNAVSFFVDDAGQMTRNFLREAIEGGSCTAVSNTGSTITGRLENADSNGEDGDRHAFGKSIAFVLTKCTFTESVNTRQPGSITFAKAGNLQVSLTPAFSGKPSGLAMCHPAVFGPGPLDKVMDAWAAYFKRQDKPGTKPIHIYAFDVRNEKEKLELPINHTIDVQLPFKLSFGYRNDRKGRDTRNDLSDRALQSFYLGQWAWVRECYHMAKADGFKWAGFMDMDELPTVLGTQSILEFLDSVPEDTQAIVAKRQEVTKIRNLQLMEGLWAQDGASVQAAQWSSPAFTKPVPPKYFKNLANSKPGKIHEPCASGPPVDELCYAHTLHPRLDQIFIRHLPAIRDFDRRFLHALAVGNPVNRAVPDITSFSTVQSQLSSSYTALFGDTHPMQENHNFELDSSGNEDWRTERVPLSDADGGDVRTPVQAARDAQQARMKQLITAKVVEWKQAKGTPDASRLAEEMEKLKTILHDIGEPTYNPLKTQPVEQVDHIVPANDRTLFQNAGGQQDSRQYSSAFENAALSDGLSVPSRSVAALAEVQTSAVATVPTAVRSSSMLAAEHATFGSETGDVHAARDAVKQQIADKIEEWKRAKQTPDGPRIANELEQLKTKLHNVGEQSHRQTGQQPFPMATPTYTKPAQVEADIGNTDADGLVQSAEPTGMSAAAAAADVEGVGPTPVEADIGNTDADGLVQSAEPTGMLAAAAAADVEGGDSMLTQSGTTPSSVSSLALSSGLPLADIQSKEHAVDAKQAEFDSSLPGTVQHSQLGSELHTMKIELNVMRASKNRSQIMESRQAQLRETSPLTDNLVFPSPHTEQADKMRSDED
eukprot:SAG31_NODE_878_length_11297_cov_3.770714_4_plen_990_part_00